MSFLTDVSADDYIFLQYMDARIGIQITKDDNIILHLQSAEAELKLLRRHGQKMRISINANTDVNITKEEHKPTKRRKAHE
jgi:hypothetical protein